jgi:hypothetical protein
MKIVVFTMMEIPNQESGNHSDSSYHFSAKADHRFRMESAGMVGLNQEISLQTNDMGP